MGKIFFGFRMLLMLSLVTIVFNSYSQSSNSKKEGSNSTITDKGVIINGVKWATRNVDASGTFAVKPEDSGMFYQWNRKTAWPATGAVTDWDATRPEGDSWAKANDPSPAGWRVPTRDEIKTLLDTGKVINEWTTQNGVTGRKFTDIATGNSMFLPAVGNRSFSDGRLFNEGVRGNYWSSTTQGGSYYVYLLFFTSDYAREGSFSRFGYSVRAVAE